MDVDARVAELKQELLAKEEYLQTTNEEPLRDSAGPIVGITCAAMGATEPIVRERTEAGINGTLSPKDGRR